MDIDFKIGDRVVVEVSGVVTGVRIDAYDTKYVVRPHNRHIGIIHAPDGTVFGEDDDEPVSAVVVPLRPLPGAALGVAA